jgi:hypothetical protein
VTSRNQSDGVQGLDENQVGSHAKVSCGHRKERRDSPSHSIGQTATHRSRRRTEHQEDSSVRRGVQVREGSVVTLGMWGCFSGFGGAARNRRSFGDGLGETRAALPSRSMHRMWLNTPA